MKHRHFWILLLCLLLLPWPTAAQDIAPPTPEPLADEQAPDPLTLVDPANAAALFGFDTFTEQEVSLYGPFDARYLTVRVPANWEVQPGAELRLNIDTFIGGNAARTVSETLGLGGLLTVRFNNVAIGQITLDQPGVSSYILSIPAEALAAASPAGRHSLAFILDAGLHCQSDYQTNVIVRNASLLYLPHEIVALPTDLAQLPAPLYQDLPTDESALIVVPDQPSQSELQAALITAAALAQQSFGRLNLTIIPEDQLRPLRDEQHLVFVGRADQLASLNSLELAADVRGDTFQGSQIQADDGVLQLTISPWNEQRSVLVVSGNSDTGVLKASQALSSGPIMPAGDESLAVVAQVQPVTNSASLSATAILSQSLPLEFRFADLGYATRTAFGIGAHFIDYEFEVPSGTELADNGVLELNFAHSSLLNYDVSGMLVRLNEQPLGSIRFSDDTTQLGQVQLRIPKGALQPGLNLLQLSADLVPNTPCIDPNLAGVWVSVGNDSRLTLPLMPRRTTSEPQLSLIDYADTLLRERTLNALTVIVPADDPAAWNAAAQFLAPLANQVATEPFSFEVLFDDQINADAPISETLQQHDLVLVGKPADLQALSAFEATLPFTFTPGTNQPNLGNSRVIYRLPADLSRGYLQLTRSPLNPDKVLMTVLGSSDEGLEWATQALAEESLRTQLDGTVAIINNDLISIEDTNLLRDTTTLAQTAVPANAQPVIYREPEAIERPQWIIPAIAVIIALMTIIILFVGWRIWRTRRNART